MFIVISLRSKCLGFHKSLGNDLYSPSLTLRDATMWILSSYTKLSYSIYLSILWPEEASLLLCINRRDQTASQPCDLIENSLLIQRDQRFLNQFDYKNEHIISWWIPDGNRWVIQRYFPMSWSNDMRIPETRNYWSANSIIKPENSIAEARLWWAFFKYVTTSRSSRNSRTGSKFTSTSFHDWPRRFLNTLGPE